MQGGAVTTPFTTAGGFMEYKLSIVIDGNPATTGFAVNERDRS
jgi:hypothetical protein